MESVLEPFSLGQFDKVFKTLNPLFLDKERRKTLSHMNVFERLHYLQILIKVGLWLQAV